MHDYQHTLLSLALILNYAKEKKDAKKQILKLLNKVSPGSRKTILQDILPAKDYKAVLYERVTWYLILTTAAKECSDSGFPGMVIYAGEVYPCQINLPDVPMRMKTDDLSQEVATIELNEDLGWAVSNEYELQKAAAEALGLKLGIRQYTCVVMFFASRNFSGVSCTFQVGEDKMFKLVKRIGSMAAF